MSSVDYVTLALSHDAYINQPHLHVPAYVHKYKVLSVAIHASLIHIISIQIGKMQIQHARGYVLYRALVSFTKGKCTELTK